MLLCFDIKLNMSEKKLQKNTLHVMPTLRLPTIIT